MYRSKDRVEIKGIGRNKVCFLNSDFFLQVSIRDCIYKKGILSEFKVYIILHKTKYLSLLKYLAKCKCVLLTGIIKINLFLYLGFTYFVHNIC